jgi:integrase
MNKGSIWARKGNTTWQIQVLINGRRYYETFHGERREAQKRLNALLVNKDKGLLVPTKLTLAQHLENWYNGYIKTKTGPRTVEAVNSIIKKHLSPALGEIKLQKLTAQLIQEYYSHALEKLSARTVYKHHRILSQSLRYAVRQGHLGANPCDLVDAPRPNKKVMRFLTPEEAEKLLETAKDSYFYPVIYFAISTGLRQAEILGLTWRDIDLDLLTISVNKALYKRKGITEFREPKTQHSRRTVCMTPKLAAFMKDYKASRESLYIQTGHVLGLDDLVFTSVDIRPLHPSVLSHNYKKIVDKAGLSGVRFHDLRHTFASLMLLRGISPKVISEALGHSSVAFTMDTYSHIIKGMQEDAMKLLDEVLPSGNLTSNYYKVTTKVDITTGTT